jgi:hypothetical protein
MTGADWTVAAGLFDEFAADSLLGDSTQPLAN